MKNTFFLSLIILICIIGSLNAADLKGFGIDIISSRAENGRTVCEAKDSDGNEFFFIFEGALSDRQADKLVFIKNTFFSWKYLNISHMAVTLSDRKIDINVIPESFEYSGIDFAEYLPSGIQFYHDAYTEYDFRMHVKSLFLRIKGQLYTEEELCETLLGAVRDPVSFLKARNPELLSSRLEETSKRIDNTQEQHSALIKLLDDLKKDYDKLRQDYTALAEDYSRLEEDRAGDRRDYAILRQDHDDRKEEHLTLQEDHAALMSDFQFLRYAVLVLHNQGLFGNIEIVDEKGIDRILALKKENPDIRQQDVTTLLAKDNISMSMNEIFLIFSVYFNQFD